MASKSFTDSILNLLRTLIHTNAESENIGDAVYRTPTGKKYHFDAECGGKNSFEVSLEEAVSAELMPCSKCAE